MPIESIQDILNDMRDRARREREGNGSTSGYAVGTMLRQFANRIDTATSRECDRCFINHMTADDSPDELAKDEKVSTSRAHSDSVTTGVETVEDVVSEMSNARKFDKDIQDWADRIDAAHKREKAVTDAMLACKGKMFPHPDPEHAPPPYPGNAAALREALKASRDYFVALRESVPGTLSEQYLAQRIADIDAAISATPRNCDVGTAEEQEERLNEFCSSHFEHCSKCPLFDKFRFCQTAWMQMPYEKEGAPK